MRIFPTLIFLAAMLGIIVAALAGCADSERTPPASSPVTAFNESMLKKIEIRTGGGSVQLYSEIADTDELKQQGLMNRDAASFPKNRGMLFVYETPAQARFWMKNMTFPIDIIFIDNYNRIVHVYENVPACTITTQPDKECKIYPSIYTVAYILEVNAGFVRENNISINDEIVLYE